MDALPALFEECCDIELRRALRTNAELFAGEATTAILSHSSVNAKLRELFAVVGERGIPLYVWWTNTTTWRVLYTTIAPPPAERGRAPK